MERKDNSPFQRDVVYNKLLPYSECLDHEALVALEEIKYNLGRSVVLKELRPGALHWSNRLFSYIKLYGHRFSKDDHVLFIKLILELIIAIDLDSQLLTGFCHLFIKLLKKRELLSRDDLVIQWQPLYQIYESMCHSKFETVGLKRHSCQLEELVKQVIRAARVYFSDDATQEMLDEWRPLMCPFDITFAKAMQYFSLFLPTTLPPEKHDKGFKLWFDELVGFWDSCHNSPSWEQFCVKLFARVAKDNVGYVDWKPYIPKIFTRVMRSFNLPLGIKSRSNSRDNYDSYVSAVWIISMMGDDDCVQSHLDNFFESVKSFYYPSNIGKYTVKLQQFLSRLSRVFTDRVHRERYKKPSWETSIPAKFQLSEDRILKFVECLKPVVLLSMFNKMGSFEAATCLQQLAQLKPAVVLPTLLDRTYAALDTLTEPHQLTASLTCITAVARPLLSSTQAFPDGPTHLIRLLTLVLPGIDANDFRKAMVTFTFISTLVSLVPLVDCSQAAFTMELSETEKEICAASGQFEDFVLLFMERCFAMIENCKFQPTSELNSGANMEKMDSQEGMLGMGLTSTFHTILMQCSPQIFKVALKHLFQFCSNKIFETKVAGQMVADFCRAAARTDSEATLKLFIPYIHSSIENITSVEGVQDEEEVDEELIWCLQLLSEVVRCNGLKILPYKQELVDVLKPCLDLKCKRAFHFAAKILHHLIPSLILLYPMEWKSSPYDFGLPPEEHLFIKDWGVSSDVDDVSMKWHIPSPEEKMFAKELLEAFLLPVLERLTQFTQGNEMTRDELQHNVDLVHHILQGSCGLLPDFQGPFLDKIEVKTLINRDREKNTVSCGPDVSLGDCTRDNIAQNIHNLLVYVLSKCEDDTKTLFTIIKIYKALLLQFGVARAEFDVRWKSAHAVKRAMQNKLCHKKRHIRALLVERIQLQHEMRVLDDRSCYMSALQELLITDLFSLSTSVYTEVRAKAQKVLSLCFESFLYSARFLMDSIVGKLKPDPGVSHEQFKGSLYILLNTRVQYLMTHYWEIIEKIWLAVAQAEHSEKPSIIALINLITDKITKKYDAVAVSRTVSTSAIDSATSLLHVVNSDHLPSSCSGPVIPLEDEISGGEKALTCRNEANLQHYNSVVEKLISLVNGNDLRWRFSQICIRLLSLLVRCDVDPPTCLVKLFTDNLVHDSLAIRKVAIASMGAILKLQKRKHPKVMIDPYAEAGVNNTENGVIQAGDRPDNYWLHYVKENLPRCEEDWDKCQFVDKTHWGYYTWPKKLYTYAPCSQQPSLDRRREDLNETEQEIFDSFSNPEFVDKLISYLSLEDRKGKDKFNMQRFVLFKGLFRNFGDTFLEIFKPHLEKLSGDTHESNQRCASEITAGLIRGSKHWTFQKLVNLWDFIIPVIKKALDNITVETIRDWGTCMATAAESRDPRRIYRLLDLLMDDPLNGSGGAFADSSRLYVLQGALAQQEWRVAELLHDLLKYIEPKLGHSYKDVRDRLGSVTCNILMCDIKLARGTPSRSPRVVDFIKTALPQLCDLKDVDLLQNNCVVTSDVVMSAEKMMVDDLECIDLSADIDMVSLNPTESFEEDDKRKSAIKLSKTVLNWLWSNSSRSLESCPSELFELLPLIVPLESQEDDQELQNLCSNVLALLSYCLLSSEALSQAVSTITKIAESPSWHSRKSILTFLQGLVCGNFFMVIENTNHVTSIQSIVLNLLTDKQLEVREAASQTLSGLIHYGFFKVDKNLQKKFLDLAATKLPKKRKRDVDLEESDVSSPYVLRHAGVLGLSSCIKAFPYDVPDWMPQMLVEIGEHLHDPNPIQATVKKVLSDFRRTHHDNWTSHKQQFSEEQLLIFTDLLVSPCYYA